VCPGGRKTVSSVKQFIIVLMVQSIVLRIPFEMEASTNATQRFEKFQRARAPTKMTTKSRPSINGTSAQKFKQRIRTRRQPGADRALLGFALQFKLFSFC
jgi:hypothetical protein